jgi:CubicO group peptidase (beta-lactamase class C family)
MATHPGGSFGTASTFPKPHRQPDAAGIAGERMTRGRRRLIAAGAVLSVVLVAGARHAARILAIGVSYKAKMFCSGVFVSKQSPGVVLADLEIDDLAVLRHITVSLDPSTSSVTASLYGIVRRRAVYREGLGCALALDGLTPPALPARGSATTAADVIVHRAAEPTLPLPADGAGSKELKVVIDQAFAETNGQRPRRTRAVVVVRHGRVAGERYAAGIGADTPLIGWSMAKSVLNALAGILVKQGRLTLDGPLPIHAWHRLGDPRSSITLDDLLRMSSGLEFDENMSNPLADVMRMLLDTGGAATYATTRRLIAPPGTKWQYSSGTSNIIACAMRNAFPTYEEYLTFPRRALFDRIGMSGAVFETDAAGTFVGSSYLYATARDWARFGMLYLQDGVWNGERVLPDGWVPYTTSPAPADPLKHYGAHFWLQVPEEYRGTDDRLPAVRFTQWATKGSS